MTVSAQEKGGQNACTRCLRHAWLLSMLSARLEYRCRDRARLIDLLALGDEQLIEAVGGRRSAELKAQYARFRSTELEAPVGIETVCRHDHRFPRALDGAASAPFMLNVAGGTERLSGLASSAVVAIVGSTRATDYGIEMAQSLGRGLAAAGVTVTSGLADGIAAAAHRGGKEVGGRTLAVMGGGLDAACPARWRWLLERVTRDGCAVSELPCGVATRQWGQGPLSGSSRHWPRLPSWSRQTKARMSWRARMRRRRSAGPSQPYLGA